MEENKTILPRSDEISDVSSSQVEIGTARLDKDHGGIVGEVGNTDGSDLTVRDVDFGIGTIGSHQEMSKKENPIQLGKNENSPQPSSSSSNSSGMIDEEDIDLSGVKFHPVAAYRVLRLVDVGQEDLHRPIDDAAGTGIPFAKEVLAVPVLYRRHMFALQHLEGKGWSLHAYASLVESVSNRNEISKFVFEFYKLGLSEDGNKNAYFVCVVLHQGAASMPELLEFIAKTEPDFEVDVLNVVNKDIQSMTLQEYREKMMESYKRWSFCDGALQPFAIVGKEFFPFFYELKAILEKNPFLARILPWGDLSTSKYDWDYNEGEGPIVWIRPGGHYIRAALNHESQQISTTAAIVLYKENQRFVPYDCPYRKSTSVKYDDKSYPHANIRSKIPTATIGLVKRIRGLNMNRDKDTGLSLQAVTAFNAENFVELSEEFLESELAASPHGRSQQWMDGALLDSLSKRKVSVKYSRLDFRDNDIYTFPRKCIHQVKTKDPTACIAWSYNMVGLPDLKPTTLSTFEDTPKSCDTLKVKVEQPELPETVPVKLQNDISSISCNADSNYPSIKISLKAPAEMVPLVESVVEKAPTKAKKRRKIKRRFTKKRAPKKIIVPVEVDIESKDNNESVSDQGD